MYTLQSSEISVAGYTLVLRAPTIEQHVAAREAFKAVDVGPVVEALKPLMGDGAFLARLLDELPSLVTLVVDGILTTGVSAAIDAAAALLDNRTNFKRLSGAPLDDEFDAARVTEFDHGPDGATYLRSAQVRAFLHATLTVDAALWILAESFKIGGYAQMGKAVMSRLLTAPKTPPSLETISA